ncbi:multicopper oxidase family protein [Paenibacillus nanensis]|uniref:multicopper oxidase family protein n=1 Tax=Paenibacillus nanensis TaxID=393251 RepID=UPI0030B8415A
MQLLLYANNGWLLVEGTVKAVVPVMAVSHLAFMLFTLPKLNKIRAEAGKSAAEARNTASHPMVVIPVYAVAAASGLCALSNIFAQPVMPSLLEMMQRPALLLVLLILPSFVVLKRYRTVLSGQQAERPFWKKLLTAAVTAAGTLFLLCAVVFAASLYGINASKLPEASDMMNHHLLDEGGGSPTMMSGHSTHQDHGGMVEVASLTGDLAAPADRKFELVAQQQKIRLSSGAVVDAWTYNGELAPELRVRYGDMVEVKLVNKDIDAGVTIHWHGYNVPNAMDGVPGMTQNVVKPGESFTYKFRAEQEGTYWFHSHQQASEQVVKGLFGSLIVESKNKAGNVDEELILINHDWVTDQGEKTAFGEEDETQTKQVEPGRKVKLRIINTDNYSQKYRLQGTGYQITAIDGVDIQEPGQLTDRTAFRVASGGRYDLSFTMPEHPVQFKMGDGKDAESPGVIFYSDTLPEMQPFEKESELFDPSHYGKPVVNELTTAAAFDREFVMILGNEMGFYNGKFHFLWTINGKVHPHTPTFVVKEGDKVKTTFVNRSLTEHPMHLHGHHMIVLKKNGREVATPWYTDTLNVYAGETYEVAFLANNPGMWMDHCHNLDHAKTGMILHLMYDHVLPSYEVGTRSGNLPD